MASPSQRGLAVEVESLPNAMRIEGEARRKEKREWTWQMLWDWRERYL